MEKQGPRTDLFDDLLPPRALARLGTVRFRPAGAYCLAFSPDGELLAGGYHDALSLWESATGREVRRFPGHNSLVESIAFSPDGKLLLSTAYKDVFLWEVATGRLLEQFPKKARRPFYPSFAALANNLDDGGRKELEKVLPEACQASAIDFSWDGKVLAWGRPDGKIELSDAATGKRQRVLAGNGKGVTSLSFSPDGKRLASGGTDQTARLWDVATGKELWTLGREVPDVAPMAVCFSPDGGRVAVVRWTHPVIDLLDATTGQHGICFEGHQHWVTAVACSADGRTVVTGGGDGTVCRWEARTGKKLGEPILQSEWLHAFALAPDGKTLATCGVAGVRIWSLDTGKELFRLKAGKHVAMAVTFAPDSKLLAVGGQELDANVRIWETGTGKQIGQIAFPQYDRHHSANVMSLSFSPDGKVLAAGCQDHTIRLYQMSSGKEIRVLRGHDNWVHQVAFSPDGKHLASAGYDWTVCLWNVQTGKNVYRFLDHRSMIDAIAFSRDGKLLARGGTDKMVHVYEVATLRELATFRGHDDWILALDFTPDGKALVSASKDTTALVWDLSELP